MTKFSIISVGCNCARFVDDWYRSIASQTKRHFECFVAVDPSKDGTAEKVKHVIRGDKRFRLIKAHKKTNHGALYNRYICTLEVEDKHSIVMHVDLDDRFYTDRAISIVKLAYAEHNCWLTYGSYTSASGGNWNKKIPNSVWKHNSHRKNAWSTSALRTFKKWLWDKIDIRDFIMPDGEWIKRGTDLAFMFPMLEMAGKSRVVFIKNILYYYNVYGYSNEERKIAEKKYIRYTRSLPRYNKINSKKDKVTRRIKVGDSYPINDEF